MFKYVTAQKLKTLNQSQGDLKESICALDFHGSTKTKANSAVTSWSFPNLEK